MESARTDIVGYLELTPSALQPIMDKYATHGAGYSPKENKTTGMHRVFRKTSGQKFWEDMTDEERREETLDAISKDLKIADKEMAGLDAPDKDKFKYYLDRAGDFLDPMAPLYKMLLKDMGAKIIEPKDSSSNQLGIKIPKHLIQYV